MSSEQDERRWNAPEIEAAARRVLDNGLGSGASTISPAYRSWAPEVAADLHHRIIDNADFGQGTFIEKLQGQLAGAEATTHLLCAELLFIHAVPLSNVGSARKRERIRRVLAWSPLDVSLPDDLDRALDAPGAFHGGTGFNVQIWRQVGWLLAFLEHWWRQPEDVRQLALSDAWAFRDIVAAMDDDQPGIRNSLLYLAFPKVFFPVVSQDHKRAIRDAFASLIGGATGNDAVAIDRDLARIRARQLQDAKGSQVHYYDEPYLSQWSKQREDPTTRRAWLIRPRPAGDALVRRWVEEGFVSLQASHLGMIVPGADRSTVMAQVDSAYQHLDYAQRVALANEFHVFLSRFKARDIVATAIGERLWVGEVDGEVEYTPDDPEARLQRAAVWTDDPIPLGDVQQVLAGELDKQGTIVDVTERVDALAALLGPDEEGDTPPAPAPPAGKPGTLTPATPEWAAALHLDKDWLQELVDLLQDRQQVILYGPPGTGKTYVADAVARHLTDGEAVRLVQFHPSYSYEDFFEGFRPSAGEDGMTFRLTPGPFRRLAADAALDPEKPYFLIIDEINRANLPKVFGELYYLLEYRRKKIYLQYSPGEEFSLPPNLYLIGTMNTADKSIASLDAAIRRRFAFVEMHPDVAPVRDLLGNWLKANDRQGDERADLLRALNAAMGERERDFKIGPSYLMTSGAERPEGLERIWRHSIMPLLQEHFYGRPEASQLEELFGLRALRASLIPASDEPSTKNQQD